MGWVLAPSYQTRRSYTFWTTITLAWAEEPRTGSTYCGPAAMPQISVSLAAVAEPGAAAATTSATTPAASALTMCASFIWCGLLSGNGVRGPGSVVAAPPAVTLGRPGAPSMASRG